MYVDFNGMRVDVGKKFVASLVTVAIVGGAVGLWQYWPRERVAYVASPAVQANSTRSVRPSEWTSPSCTGVPTEYTYRASTTYRINENFCQLRGLVRSGCVTWLNVMKQPLAQTCGGAMPSVDGIVMLRADTEAVVRLNRCVNLAPGNLVDACM